MRVRACAALCALALGASAADLNGPMSSTPRPAASATAGAVAAQPSPAGAFDVNKLFATTCGWCHSNGGRVAGKGPQLMDTRLTDAEIIARIKSGKPGAMPAFGTAFDEAQLQAIVLYIRGLRAQGAPQ